MEDDRTLLEKPGRINFSEVNTSKLPLAGKLTEIGQQILKIGSQKAKFICTGNWEFKFARKDGVLPSSQSTRPNMKKITDFDASTFIEKPKKVIQSSKDMSKSSVVDRLQKAMKTGRITPLENRRNTTDKMSMTQ